MATDRFPTMHQPWGAWPPPHMQGPYMTSHWQAGTSSSNGNSCMYGSSEYQTEKPPLTQLQELTSVFPSIESAEPNRLNHPCQQEQPSRCENTSFLPDMNFRVKECFENRQCDSGYVPDSSRIEKPCEREADAGYGSDRPVVDTECDTGYQTETLGPRECDSGFGPTYSGKEETDTFPDLCGECDSGCGRDLPLPSKDNIVPDLGLASLADSDSGCADLNSKWEEETPCALPGFHQAFGSTEIGRFSRNDFFTNPSPQQTSEPINDVPRKAVRKPRSPRVKQVRKERMESPKLPQIDSRAEREELSNVPISEGMQCNSRMCNAPYDSCGQRYCPDYPPHPSHSQVPLRNNYPYARHSAPYPSYQHCDIPYFRPFSFPLNCPQTWPEPRWPPYQPPYQQHYQQPYQTQQPWTSANVYPFMRLDY